MTATAGLTPEAELHDVHETERIRPYMAELWSRRGYVWYVSASELRSREVTNVLGNLWYLLNPVLNIAVFYLIFGLLLGVDRGVDNFMLFLTVGIFVFQFTQRSTLGAAQSVVGNVGLIKSIKFPRAILPLTTTLTETLASLTSFVVVFAVAFLTGQDPRWQWVLLVPILAVQTLFNGGLAMLTARATTHFRDLQQILPFLFRLLLYGSGVIFSVTAYAAGREWIELIFVLNPVYCFITIARWAVSGDDVSAALVASAALWTVAVTVGGLLWFRAGEERYARD